VHCLAQSRGSFMWMWAFYTTSHFPIGRICYLFFDCSLPLFSSDCRTWKWWSPSGCMRRNKQAAVPCCVFSLRLPTILRTWLISNVITMIYKIIICLLDNVTYRKSSSHSLFFLFSWRYNPLCLYFHSPVAGFSLLVFARFLDHTQRRATVGRTPLDG
jgi:hypothetical protein